MTKELPVGKLAKGMNLSEVAAHHGLPAEALKQEILLGIKTEQEHTDDNEIARAIALDHLYEDPQYYQKLQKVENTSRKEKLDRLIMLTHETPNKSAQRAKLWYRLKNERAKMAEGGNVVDEKGNSSNDGKKGGYFDGRSHANGGIKAVNVDTNQPIEVEGDEVIITKKAVQDPTKRDFMGQKLTNREILSKINQSGGGVAFAKGGPTPDCGCKSLENGGPAGDISLLTCKEVENLITGLAGLSVQAPQLHPQIVDIIVHLKQLQIIQNC